MIILIAFPGLEHFSKCGIAVHIGKLHVIYTIFTANDNVVVDMQLQHLSQPKLSRIVVVVLLSQSIKYFCKSKETNPLN